MPADQKLQELRVYIAPDVVAYLVRLGSGDAKAGIEVLAKNGPVVVDATTGPRDGISGDDPKAL